MNKTGQESGTGEEEGIWYLEAKEKRNYCLSRDARWVCIRETAVLVEVLGSGAQKKTTTLVEKLGGCA